MSKTATLSLLFACLLLPLFTGCTAITEPMEDEIADPEPPPPFSISLRTEDEDDRITVSSNTRDLDGLMQVCLNVRSSGGAWKGLGLNERDPSLEAKKKDGLTCTTLRAGTLQVALWKAGFLGIRKHVGDRSLNLRAYGNHRVTFTWTRD